MKKVFGSYAKKGTGHILKRLSIADKKILEDFLKYCSMTAKEKRIQKNKTTLLEIYDVLEKPLNIKPNLEDIRGLVALINHSDKEQWTKNDLLRTLKRFLKWKWHDLNLIEEIHTKKGFNSKKINESTLITPQEAEALIRTAETLRLRALITLFIESGCRPQEICNLKWKDLKFDDKNLKGS